MSSKLRILAVATIALASVSTVAVARSPCIPGYTLYRGVCYPTHVHNYRNPVSGAMTGEAQGAAQGYATAGPVGAMVGGALGTATGTLSGTANMLSGR